MQMRKLSHIIYLSLFTSFCLAQPAILDPCFTSGTPGTSFASTANLGDVGANADLCNWTGAAWTGGWAGANLTKVPPINAAGCRAIWCGSGTAWTTGGEGMGVKVASGFVTGTTYTYNVTYVSHGTGSTGAFNPIIYTNSAASLAGAVTLGNMPAVGTAWTTNKLTFVASAAQSGHTWLIFGTWSSLSSGFINAFCNTCNVSTLPIELISFEVEEKGNKKVLAKWSTASETNNDHFILQRSKNAIDFTDVSEIKGTGNSNNRNNYSFVDEQAFDGTSYYRLKQINSDRSDSYSQLKTVNFYGYSGVKLYPNPTNGSINLPPMQNDALLTPENAEIEITDNMGVAILKLPYSNTLDISSLNAGYYHLKIKMNSGPDFSYKIIKQ